MDEDRFNCHLSPTSSAPAATAGASRSRRGAATGTKERATGERRQGLQRVGGGPTDRDLNASEARAGAASPPCCDSTCSCCLLLRAWIRQVAAKRWNLAMHPGTGPLP